VSQVEHVPGVVREKWTTHRAVVDLRGGRQLAVPIPVPLRETVHVGTKVVVSIAESGRIEGLAVADTRDVSITAAPKKRPHGPAEQAPAGNGQHEETPAELLFGDLLKTS